MSARLRFLILWCLVLGTASAAVAAEALKVGAQAPSAEAVDHEGKPWRLADWLKQGPVLVYFYPKDDTPGCTKQACGLRDQFAALKQLGVSVVGVSRDDAESHRKFREKHELPFTLIADVEGKVTDAFGAAAPDRPRSRRVSFLVDRDGKIVHITDNRDAQVHLDALKEAVARLGTKTGN